jgi:mRNA interferase RelE/StbE
MTYSVDWTKQGLKDFSKLDKTTQTLLLKWICKNLDNSQNPRALPNAKKLVDVKDGWRWRVGTYRILGRIVDDKVIIELFRVGHRKNVYRHLPPG